MRWYAEHDVKPTFEIVPGQYDTSLGQELARLGFYQSGFHASLIGEPAVDGHTDGEVAIEQVATTRAMEDYLDAYVAGWGIPEKDRVQFKSNVRPWLEQAGWSLYLACVNGHLPLLQLTRQPILHFAVAAFRPRCSGSACATRASPGLISFSVVPSRTRPVIAIWNASACACNSCGQSGPGLRSKMLEGK